MFEFTPWLLIILGGRRSDETLGVSYALESGINFPLGEGNSIFFVCPKILEDCNSITPNIFRAGGGLINLYNYGGNINTSNFQGRFVNNTYEWYTTIELAGIDATNHIQYNSGIYRYYYLAIG